MQKWRIKRMVRLVGTTRIYLSFSTRLYELLTFLELTYSLNGNLREIVAAKQKSLGIAGKEQLKC
jgi:hypothetical protein